MIVVISLMGCISILQPTFIIKLNNFHIRITKLLVTDYRHSLIYFAKLSSFYQIEIYPLHNVIHMRIMMKINKFMR